MRGVRSALAAALLATMGASAGACCSSGQDRRCCHFRELEGEIGVKAPEEDSVHPLQSGPAGEVAKTEHRAAASSAEEQDEEEEDDDEDQPEFQEFARQQARLSIGATFEKRRVPVFAEQTPVNMAWKRPAHPKTPTQQAWLTRALTKSVLFAGLAPDDREKVVEAFTIEQFQAEHRVIEEGAHVGTTDPALFVLEMGMLDVHKAGESKPIRRYSEPGEYFGELALLYDAPRAATVTAVTKVRAWWIDRNTYNYLVKDASAKSRERRQAFLKEVSVLNGLTDDELATLSDACEIREVEAGTTIIRQGDEANDFFVVESGRCEARSGGECLYTFEERSYFGELALISKKARAADVVAVQPTRLLVIGVAEFTRLLGSLEDLMRERAQQYGSTTFAAVEKRASERGA